MDINKLKVGDELKISTLESSVFCSVSEEFGNLIIKKQLNEIDKGLVTPFNLFVEVCYISSDYIITMGPGQAYMTNTEFGILKRI